MAKYCNRCGEEMIKIRKSWVCINCNDDEDEDDPCVACGNPAYPDCMDSCPIYDD